MNQYKPNQAPRFDVRQKEKKNDFHEEEKKFLNKHVVVHYQTNSGKEKTIEGVLRAINPHNQSVILFDNDDKIIIRVYLRIHRKRDKSDHVIS